jgi:hypothetical protein
MQESIANEPLAQGHSLKVIRLAIAEIGGRPPPSKVGTAETREKFKICTLVDTHLAFLLYLFYE